MDKEAMTWEGWYEAGWEMVSYKHLASIQSGDDNTTLTLTHSTCSYSAI